MYMHRGACFLCDFVHNHASTGNVSEKRRAQLSLFPSQCQIVRAIISSYKQNNDNQARLPTFFHRANVNESIGTRKFRV